MQTNFQRSVRVRDLVVGATGFIARYTNRGTEKFCKLFLGAVIISTLMGFKTADPVIAQDEHVFRSCDYVEEYYSGDYRVLNNPWNWEIVPAGVPNMQCYWVNSVDPVSAGWEWSWPSVPPGVAKSFPNITYGWKPWRTWGSSTSHLPVQLSSMGGFLADYDIEISAENAVYNTAFEIWITSSAVPTPETVTREIMIFVEDQTDWSLNHLKSFGRVFIDKEKYDLYIDLNRPEGFTYILFKKVVPMPKGSIKIDSFLRYLVREGMVSSTEYLADIEFGNELVSGSGQTTIRSYSITPSAAPLVTTNYKINFPIVVR